MENGECELYERSGDKVGHLVFKCKQLGVANLQTIDLLDDIPSEEEEGTRE